MPGNAHTLALIIKAAEKLKRLDPDYAAGMKANARRTAKMTKHDAAHEIERTLDLYESLAPADVTAPRQFDDLLYAFATRDRSQPKAESSPKPKSNGRPTEYITHNGITLSLREWAERVQLTKSCIYQRLRAGYSVEDALTLADRGRDLKRRTGGKAATITRSRRAMSLSHAKRYAFDGEAKTLGEWALARSIGLHALRCRIKRGWSIEAALTIPIGSVPGRRSHGGGWVRTLHATREDQWGRSRDTEAKQALFQPDREAA